MNELADSALLQVWSRDSLALELPLLILGVKSTIEERVGIHPGDNAIEIVLR